MSTLVCRALLPSELGDLDALKLKPGIAGFRTFILRADAAFEPESTDDEVPLPHRITITTHKATLEFLAAILARMTARKLGERLLTRLTIKGNFIWRETPKRQTSSSGPAGWLDGDSWRVTPRQHPSAMQSLFVIPSWPAATAAAAGISKCGSGWPRAPATNDNP